jgi:hypothetical protein
MDSTIALASPAETVCEKVTEVPPTSPLLIQDVRPLNTTSGVTENEELEEL